VEKHHTDIDQNPVKKPSVQYYQGLINLLPVTRTSGGNVLIEKSQRLFPHHFTSHANREHYASRLNEVDGDDWLEIDADDKVLICEDDVICCQLEPGDMLIWDSRLAHCSYPGKYVETEDNCCRSCAENISSDGTTGMEMANQKSIKDLLSKANGLIRAATLVSMRADSPLSPEIATSRKIASVNCQSLTHWVDKASILAGERLDEVTKERSRVDWMKKNKPDVLLAYCDLDDKMRRLIC